MSGLFILGEVLYRLLGPSGLIVIIISFICLFALNNIFRPPIKSLNLLFFLSFFLGFVWGIGLYSDGKKLAHLAEEEKEAYIEAYISSKEETSLGFRLTMTCDDGSFIMYVNDEIKIGSVGNGTEDENLVPGRYLKLHGHFKRLKGHTNPGSIDLEQYYLGRGIMCEFKPDSINIDYSRKRFLRFYLGRIRSVVGKIVDEYFSEDEAAIIKTMILGEKSGLSTESKLLFQRNGIAHILAISGLHVGLLAGIISALLIHLRIGRKKADIISIVVLFLYGLMTGFSPATMRAVIMITVYKLAFICGRTADMPTSMLEALLIMIILNPESIFSPGLLMSFASVLGVFTGMAFYKRIFRKERFLDLPIKLRGYLKIVLNGLIMSMSINLWMLPLIIMSYSEVPIYAMFLNFMVVPLLTFVVVCGGLVMMFGYLSIFVPVLHWLCPCPRWVCSAILGFYRYLCKLFLKLPGSTIMTGHTELWQMLTYYVGVTTILLLLYRSFKRGAMAKGGMLKGLNLRRDISKAKGGKLKGLNLRRDISKAKGGKLKELRMKWGSRDKKRRNTDSVRGMIRRYIFLILVYTFCMMSFIFTIYLFNKVSFHVVFLDVGQGDGSIIHTGKRNYIIDCGSSDNSSVGQYALIPALKYYGMDKVDMIFVSHTDSDHISGIIYLIENSDLYGIEIGGVAFAAGTEHDENYERVKRAIGGDKVFELRAGDLIEDDFEVLYPRPEDVSNEKLEHGGNDYSLVLEYKNDEKNLRILYTGDIGNDAEKNLAECIPDNDRLPGEKQPEGVERVGNEEKQPEKTGRARETRILKCAHHGSKYSSSDTFLSSYLPDMTVISCGEHNMYGHPSPETLERLEAIGCEVYRTDKNGAIIIGGGKTYE